MPIEAIAGILGFIAGILVSFLAQLARDKMHRKRRRKQLLELMCAEIVANIERLQLEHKSKQHDLKVLDRVGYVTKYDIGYPAIAYRSVISELPLLGENIVTAIMQFYKFQASVELSVKMLNEARLMYEGEDRKEVQKALLYHYFAEMEKAIKSGVIFIEAVSALKIIRS